MTAPALATSVLISLHQAVVRWTRDVLDRAGLQDVALVTEHAPEASPFTTVVLRGGAVVPWPKLSEPLDAQPLLGSPAPRSGPSVPRPWSELAALVGQVILDVFPVVAAQGRPPRPLPWAPLASLPAPLRSWYEERGRNGDPEGWLGDNAGQPSARMPSLSWRPAMKLRAGYRYEFLPGTQADSTPLLAVSGAILLGTHLGRQVSVTGPSLVSLPSFRAWLEAMAGAASGETEGRLAGLVPGLLAPIPQVVALLPEGPADDGAGVFRASGEAPVRSLGLYLHLGLGGGPLLGPTAAPALTSLLPITDAPEPA